MTTKKDQNNLRALTINNTANIKPATSYIPPQKSAFIDRKVSMHAAMEARRAELNLSKKPAVTAK
jgi:hypothetical protein